MILMPQIFNVIANENARYKRNELEFIFDKSWNCENCRTGNITLYGKGRQITTCQLSTHFINISTVKSDGLHTIQAHHGAYGRK